MKHPIDQRILDALHPNQQLTLEGLRAHTKIGMQHLLPALNRLIKGGKVEGPVYKLAVREKAHA